jgi:hypothetical protein
MLPGTIAQEPSRFMARLLGSLKRRSASCSKNLAFLYTTHRKLHLLGETTKSVRERIHMMFEDVNVNYNEACVVLSSPDPALAARRDLDGPALYNRRVQINKFWPKLKSLASELLALRWGWYANKSSSLKHRKLRYPHKNPKIGILYLFR